MQFHEVANIFPMMSAEEFAALKADIQQNGLREPIWTHQGAIIDGRNRYNACCELGITPDYREWSGEGSLLEFVVSLNLKRRHLTSTQRAVIALDLEKLLAEEAKKRNGGRPSKNGAKPTQKIEQVADRNGRTAAAQAANILNTNRLYVGIAKRVAAAAPEILPLIREGKIRMPEAQAIMHLGETKRAAVIEKINSGEAKSGADARRKVQLEDFFKPMRVLSAAIEKAPVLALYKEAVEHREIETVRYSALTNAPGQFAGLRLKNLVTPFAGQTWHWPKYSGAVFEPIEDTLQKPNPDLNAPLFTELEWDEFTSLDERETVEDMEFPGCEWFQWTFGMEFDWATRDFLREPWDQDGLRRRDYDPTHGRKFIDSQGESVIRGDKACRDCRGKQMFIRQGWGQWVIAEYNDGQGGREKRRFFEHDHCGPTLIKQAVATVDPLAFSDVNIRRLKIFKTMPVEITWYAFRHKTISVVDAITALEEDLEALRNATPLTESELTERVLDWLQSYTPVNPYDWREGECTYPRLSDGSLDKDQYRKCLERWRHHSA